MLRVLNELLPFQKQSFLKDSFPLTLRKGKHIEKKMFPDEMKRNLKSIREHSFKVKTITTLRREAAVQGKEYK